MKSHIKEIVTDALLIGLSADLLYLYFVGAWYDPWKWLEILEVVILLSVIGFGLWRLLMYIGGIK